VKCEISAPFDNQTELQICFQTEFLKLVQHSECFKKINSFK